MLPPDWWVTGPIVETIACSECGDRLVRYWDMAEFYCKRCGIDL